MSIIPQYGIPIVDKLEKFVWSVIYWLARFAVPPLAFLKITPNQVTFWSAVINFSAAAFCFSRGTYLWSLGGLFFLLLHTYFDLVDGSLARFTGKTSKMGRWLDMVCDYIGTAIVFIGIGYGIFRQTNNSFWMIVTVMIIFAKFSLSIAHLYYGNTVYRSMNFRKEFKKSKKMTFPDWLIENFIIPDSSFFFFFYNIRYFLFLTILFNQLNIFLILTAVLFNIRWMVLLWAYSRVLQDNKKEFWVIKLLKKYIDGVNFDEG